MDFFPKNRLATTTNITFIPFLRGHTMTVTKYYKVPIELLPGAVLLSTFNPGALPVLGLNEIHDLVVRSEAENRQIFARVTLEPACLVVQQLITLPDSTLMHEQRLGNRHNPISRVLAGNQPFDPNLVAKITPAFIVLRINPKRWTLAEQADEYELSSEETRDILNN